MIICFERNAFTSEDGLTCKSDKKCKVSLQDCYWSRDMISDDRNVEKICTMAFESN